MSQKFIILKLSNIRWMKMQCLRYKIINYRLDVNVCTTNDIGDEYHYLFSCDFFKSNKSILNHTLMLAHIKYRELLSSTNEDNKICWN